MYIHVCTYICVCQVLGVSKSHTQIPHIIIVNSSDFHDVFL